MKKNLASKVFDCLNLNLTMTERGLLAYLLGWFLDEDKGYCDLSQTRIAQALIRRRKLATTSDAYRRTVNVYLSRLERTGLICKVAAGPGRVARLSPGPILQAAIDSARENPKETPPIGPAETCPCCGQVMGMALAGHGQVSIHETMTQEPEPTLSPTPLVDQTDERESLVEEIIQAKTALAAQGKTAPIRSTTGYRRTLRTNSTIDLRQSLDELKALFVRDNPSFPANSIPSGDVEDFVQEADLVDEAETLGQAELETLPAATLEKIVDQEVEARLRGENGQTWHRWDRDLQREQARYHLAVRMGMGILNAKSNQRTPQSPVDRQALIPQTIHHIGFRNVEESPHAAI